MKKITGVILALACATGLTCFGCHTSTDNSKIDTRPDNETDTTDNNVNTEEPANNDDSVAGTDNTGTPQPPDEPNVISPYIDDDFAGSSSIWKLPTNTTPGSVTFAYADPAAEDGRSVRILFGGNPSFGPSDKVGPNNSKDITLNEKLGYGIYKFRVKPATCSASDEEMITGIFIYANNGSDANGNGMIDNNEIDVEFACSLPSTFWLTVWTDYQEKDGVEKAKRQTRRIRFTDGTYKDTVQNGTKSTITETKGNLPASLKDASFDQRAQYLTLGFEWRASFVRFFIEKNGEEIDLWNMSNQSYLPAAPAYFLVNLWHARSIWSSPESALADYPKSDVTVLVDYFKYWK